MSDPFLNTLLESFKMTQSITDVFVLPLVVFGVVSSQVTMGRSVSPTDIFIGVFSYFALCLIFPITIEMLTEVPVELAGVVFAGRPPLPEPELQDVPTWLERVIIGVGSFVYALIYWLYRFLNMLLVSCAPLVFLLSCILGLGVTAKTFFAGIIYVSCWPLIWVALDAGFYAISSQDAELMSSGYQQLVAATTVGLLKLGTPIAMMKFGSASAGFGGMFSRSVGSIGSAGKLSVAGAKAIDRNTGQHIERAVGWTNAFTKSKANVAKDRVLARTPYFWRYSSYYSNRAVVDRLIASMQEEGRFK